MPTKGIGRLLQIGFAKEAVRGTAEAAATFWIPNSEFGFEEKFNTAVDESSYGVIEDAVDQKIIQQWAEGSGKIPIGDKSFGLILLATLGAVNTTDNADSDPTVKDHTFSVGQSAQHQSLTVFIDDPLSGVDYKHALGVVTGLELNYEQGKLLEFTPSLKAKKGTSGALTPSTTVENKFLPQHLTFKMAATQAGLDAAAAVIIKSATLKIETNIEDDFVLGNVAPVDFLNKQFSIEGTIEAMWSDETTFKTAALAGTVKAMRFDLKNTDVTIGAAANPEIKIDLHKVYFKDITRPIKSGDTVKQTLSFKAFYNTTDSKMITAIITNAQASY